MTSRSSPNADPHADKDAIVEEALGKGFTLVEHGLLVLDSHVNIMGRVMDETEGQDKLFKIGQASLKIWISILTRYVLPRNDGFSLIAKDIILRFKTCMKATMVSRRFFKVFHTAVFIRLFWQVSTDEPFGLLKLLVLGTCLNQPNRNTLESFFFTHTHTHTLSLSLSSLSL